jgi:hypothetical protein
MIWDFVAGFGLATFIIFGWAQLTEIVRHRSMLEYPDPEIYPMWCIMIVLGFIAWVLGSFMAGAP